MKRWTKLLLIAMLTLPTVAWAGHQVIDRAGCCPLCDDCPMKNHK